MSCSTAVGRWCLVFGGSQEKGALMEDEERAGSDLAMRVCWRVKSLLANEAGWAGSEFLGDEETDGGCLARVRKDKRGMRLEYLAWLLAGACLKLT